ncbi:MULTISPECIES: acyl carrier protein [Olivibacter]|jgi:acyl carrier protein|uniref:Acyl carrier protein n=3 Tax=Sphingobacteriaceae TaxID=84566 RepID=F4C2F6_SPHS2|nr:MULTISPECIES: acyl carrier protein [Olivibacter]MCL4640977.1 acyl carrier protein [Olivibacter sp. UJ_SKK_5.1]MDM8175427.1 acyl carrier protein [Olivibacter sp. 47]MDX3914040.1 acyl carrier protein [Pseudosphingobacterium sp.]QEL02185.1 acyl carrier protein [Olivibacter sp. LS-1]
MDTVENYNKLKSEEIFSLLKQFITDIIGEEFIEEMDISMESSFTKDLEMDSIEIVSFSEKVKAHFGEGIDFTGWLSGLDLDQLIDLKIKDIVNYILSSQV